MLYDWNVEHRAHAHFEMCKNDSGLACKTLILLNLLQNGTGWANNSAKTSCKSYSFRDVWAQCFAFAKVGFRVWYGNKPCTIRNDLHIEWVHVTPKRFPNQSCCNTFDKFDGEVFICVKWFCSDLHMLNVVHSPANSTKHYLQKARL